MDDRGPASNGDGALPPPPDNPPPPSDASAPGGRGRAAFDRVPPHSLEAEVSVIGACLLSNAAAIEVSEFLRPDDFYRSAHRTVYEAIQDLMARGEPIDPVTLLDQLAATGRLAEVGGAPAVHELVSATPTAANAVHYGRIVRERALLRRLIEAGTEIVQMGYDPTDDPIATVSMAESVMFQVADQGTTGEAVALKDLLNESFMAIEERAERGDDVIGLPTGFRDLDRLTAGLQPDNLIILAARPAMGKCGYFGMRVPLSDGSVAELGELVERGAAGKPATVQATTSELRLVSADVAEFHDNDVAVTFAIRTRLGRETRVTANHPFLTPSGWRELRDLRPGDLLALPRALPVEGRDRLAPAEAGLLGYLLGDGSLRGRSAVLTASLPAVVQEACEFAAAFGTRGVVKDLPHTDAKVIAFRLAHERVTVADVAARCDVPYEAARRTLAGSPAINDPIDAIVRAADELGWTGSHPTNWLLAWLEELGLWGCDSHDKFVPDVIFRAPNDQVAMFLSRLYATDGSAWVAEEHGYFGISYASVSERLIRDVQHLLLRFGIIARLRERQVAYTTPEGEKTRRPAFELEIRDAENVLRFLDEIGIFAKDEACAKVRAAAAARTHRHNNTDLLPVEIWDRIVAAKGDRSWADVSEATGRPRNHNWHVGKRRPSRRLVAEIAEALDSDDLRTWAHSDVYWDEVVSITEHGPERVFDLTIPEHHNFVADDIVVHNSSLSMSLAHYVTAELRKPVVLFSLEMSKQEIVQRLLASEAMIDSSRIKTGRLEDHDWRKLGEALGKLAEAPLYIDDTPAINLVEIMNKCRRLKQRYGLELVIVDYLQLMQGHRRTDNRQEEVAHISRGLKMLAKELHVPVMALSQLSRQPESRTDKRPMLADLRESGCLTRDMRLLRSDTGQPVTFGELVDSAATDVPVWATDDRGRLVSANLTHAFPSGVKQVFRVRTRSGAAVEASGNHPFRTLDGWTPLDELETGSRVALARRLPPARTPAPMDEDELALLAHLLGEGTIVARQPIHYTSADEDNLAAVEAAAHRRFGITARRVADARSPATTQLYLPAPHRLTHGRRNPIAEWLDGLGAWNRRAWQKRIPREVFGLPEDQLRFFLRHLFATDGSVTLRVPKSPGSPQCRLYYSTTSEGLATDLKLLLARIGLQARVRRVSRPRSDRGRVGWTVDISGVRQQRNFLRSVGFHGERGKRIPGVLQALAGIEPSTNVDTIPEEVWDLVRAERTQRGMSERQFQAAIGTSYCGTTLYRAAPSRQRMGRVADVLEDQRLSDLAQSDLFWDEIVEIEPLGEREVFDATVEGVHNFVCEGLVLHNSIEQDADIVAFIYRDEVYNEDSPDRGIAELIVSKHRNGATGVVKLAFLGHVTKFANLARGAAPVQGPPGAPPPAAPMDAPPI